MIFWGHKKQTGKETGQKVKAQNFEVRFTHRVLLLVDGWSSSMASLEKSIVLAERMSLPLYVVYVVDTSSLDALQQLRMFVAEERKEYEAEMERNGERFLKQAGMTGASRGIKIETELLHGHFDQMALEVSQRHDADLIVMGGLKRGADDSGITTRIRNLVLDAVSCPVVLVNG